MALAFAETASLQGTANRLWIPCGRNCARPSQNPCRKTWMLPRHNAGVSASRLARQ